MVVQQLIAPNQLALVVVNADRFRPGGLVAVMDVSQQVPGQS